MSNEASLYKVCRKKVYKMFTKLSNSFVHNKSLVQRDKGKKKKHVCHSLSSFSCMIVIKVFFKQIAIKTIGTILHSFLCTSNSKHYFVIGFVTPEMCFISLIKLKDFN